eukprot:530077-Prymnesium_polylepis.1
MPGAHPRCMLASPCPQARVQPLHAVAPWLGGYSSTDSWQACGGGARHVSFEGCRSHRMSHACTRDGMLGYCYTGYNCRWAAQSGAVRRVCVACGAVCA